MSTARRGYAHAALLALPRDADDRAPGGAVTLALCGSWDHEPPCPLAAHRTAAVRTGDRLAVRVVFAAVPDDEARVREVVHGALAGGHCTGPNGVDTAWRLLDDGPSELRPDERALADRLGGG
ncbi:hypothetical protein [Geodermatophilus sp. CPCC 206100]|uniref:hypothetical protein n=1 Tax=Geodermatophilus sp. CPCC 206100 TaxID=3020054 RepID=UPI003B0068D7